MMGIFRDCTDFKGRVLRAKEAKRCDWKFFFMMSKSVVPDDGNTQ